MAWAVVSRGTPGSGSGWALRVGRLIEQDGRMCGWLIARLLIPWSERRSKPNLAAEQKVAMKTRIVLYTQVKAAGVCVGWGDGVWIWARVGEADHS